MNSEDVLNIWTVYFDTSDVPGVYSARRWESSPEGVKATDDLHTARTLAEVRALLPPGMTRLDRDPLDDIVIVEAWL